MTYFEASRAEKKFREYRQLTLDYWAAVEKIDYGGNKWMLGRLAPDFRDTNKSRPIRERISQLQPEILIFGHRLGVGVTGTSFPAPAVGGAAIPFNLLACVIDQTAGHITVPRERVLDAIDSCIGAAGAAKRQSGARLVKPWCWLVDVPALIVGWPFVVMRKAGVPEKMVEGTGAQITKAVLTAGLWVLALYLGFRHWTDLFNHFLQ